MVLEVGSLDAGGLRALLRERAAQCLLLDCRSFFAFNAGHIAGSVNVRFSTIVRRRAKGAMGLEHIVPNAELRGRLLAGAYHAVVLLDERSAALDAAKRDGTLALAAGALCREARATQVFFLKGTPLGKLRAGRTPPSALPGARLALGPCPIWSAGAPESYSGDLSLALFVWLREQRLPGETSSPGGWGSCVEGALSQRY